MRASITEEMEYNSSIGVLLMRRSDDRDGGSEVFLMMAYWSEDDILDSICKDEKWCIRIDLLVGSCVFEHVL
jgi:hypothetical protein